MRKALQQELIESIFSDERIYAEKVLNIGSDRDRTEVMQIIAGQIVKERLRDVLHFAYIKDFEDLSTSRILPTIIQILLSETIQYLEEELHMSMKAAKECAMRAEYVRFVKEFAERFNQRFGSIILETVADTLLERIAQMPSTKKVRKVIRVAIEGDTKHRSLMMFNDGTRAVMTVDQAWAHVHQASSARKRDIQVTQMALSRMLTELRELDDKKDKEYKEEVLAEYSSLQSRLDAIRQTPLSQYNLIVRRMRQAIVESLRSYGKGVKR